MEKKRILVTGSKGKFVTYFRHYIENHYSDISFEFVSLRGEDWKIIDFENYDSVIHCAGITSAPNDDYNEFYKVNVELTRELFNKVVGTRAKHFVYLSSMAVYDGIGWGFGKEGLVTKDTIPVQKTNYGRSKFEAEEAIGAVENLETKVAIVRAPSIVGGGLEAYFDRYMRFSRIPFVSVPTIHLEAKRSFVFIDTLIDYLCSLSIERREGVFFPQNYPQMSVSEMLFEVCAASGNPKRMGSWGKILPKTIKKRFFSQICYDKGLSDAYIFDGISSKEAIKRTVTESRKG